jgi:hypothetical protein
MFLTASNFTNACVNSNRELGSKQNGRTLVVPQLLVLVGLLVECLFQVQVRAVLGLGAVLSVYLQSTIFDLQQEKLMNY